MIKGKTLHDLAKERVDLEKQIESLEAKRKICLDKTELTDIALDIELAQNKIANIQEK